MIKTYNLNNYNLIKHFNGSSRKKDFQATLFLPILNRQHELKLEQPELLFTHLEDPNCSYQTFEWTAFAKFQNDPFVKQLIPFYQKYQNEIIFAGNPKQMEFIQKINMLNQFEVKTYEYYKLKLQKDQMYEINGFTYGNGFTKTYGVLLPEEQVLLYHILYKI